MNRYAKVRHVHNRRPSSQPGFGDLRCQRLSSSPYSPSQDQDRDCRPPRTIEVGVEISRPGRGASLSCCGAGSRCVACGRATWAPRRIGDRDLVWWLVEAGFFDAPFTSLPGPEARLYANVVTTGHDAGHDLHPADTAGHGCHPDWSLSRIRRGEVRFAPDLEEAVAWGDARYRQLMDLVRRLTAERKLKPIDLGARHFRRSRTRGGRLGRLRSGDLRKWLSPRLPVVGPLAGRV